MFTAQISLDHGKGNYKSKKTKSGWRYTSIGIKQARKVLRGLKGFDFCKEIKNKTLYIKMVTLQNVTGR